MTYASQTRATLARVGWSLAILVLFAIAGRQLWSDILRTGPSDADAIEATLKDYLYGLRDGDVQRLRRAFHPTAEIEGIRDSVFTSWSIREYLSGMVPGQRRPFIPRILSVDHIGAAASGKVESDYGTWKFVDYMQLLKIDGQWKIVNKIYERVVNLDVVQ